jgi:excisionase family DNA binding protein
MQERGPINSELKSQPNGDALVSYKEAASMLRICSRTLRRMVEVGKLGVVHIGRRVFFHLSDILRIQEHGI